MLLETYYMQVRREGVNQVTREWDRGPDVWECERDGNRCLLLLWIWPDAKGVGLLCSKWR